GNIDLVEEWFRWWVAGTGMCAHVTNVTSGSAAINVAGPRARDTLGKLTEIDLSPEGFKYMRSASGVVAGVPSLLMRIGFVGETGWEVHFPAEYGEYIWDALLEAGREFGISPFGVEAQRILRLEKKHLIPGQDTDVTSNPLEADMGWAVRFDKEDFIGRSALKAVKDRGLRNRLVGFVMDAGAVPKDGVPVLLDGRPVGKVTSARLSPTLGTGFGLAWVPVNLAEEGKEIRIRVEGKAAPARVTLEPVYDPEGKHLRE
ncbi:MAG: aminomethyltransferase family protein, partial [Dehalococcoidia bacterium]